MQKAKPVANFPRSILTEKCSIVTELNQRVNYFITLFFHSRFTTASWFPPSADKQIQFIVADGQNKFSIVFVEERDDKRT